jgi:glutathione S-transferase
MVQLIDSDIKTREVTQWRGVHVLHYSGSTCSQKLRIFLNLKGTPWHSRLIDLPKHENYSPWFLGVNPRGLVPVFVHDGKVHIESNDIITYLERAFPTPRLIPAGHEQEIAKLLHHEDDLHLDLRALSFRFIFDRKGPPRSPELLKIYEDNGSGTVHGIKDKGKAVQIDFCRRAADEGFPDQMVRESVLRFKTEFEALDETLRSSPYLFGDALSVVDIAWFIYAHRLELCGYPLRRRHPHLSTWFDKLARRQEFRKEISLPPRLLEQITSVQRSHRESGRTLETIAAI